MEVTGKVYRIDAVNQVSEKFKKREFILETDGQYPQFISLECQQDNCSRLDGIFKGETITAHINLRGRLWTSPKGEERCFNTLVVWKIDAVASTPPAGQVPDTDPNLPF